MGQGPLVLFFFADFFILKFFTNIFGCQNGTECMRDWKVRTPFGVRNNLLSISQVSNNAKPNQGHNYYQISLIEVQTNETKNSCK